MKAQRYPYIKVLLLSLAFSLILHAPISARQQPVPTEQPAPDFSLNVSANSGAKAATKTLKDFAGKWLILDFWTRTCAVCIASMPKINQLQQQFKDQVQFLLVGKNDRRYNSGIEKLYSDIALREKLELAVAFDSTIFSTYGVRYTPHVAIIDPQGILKVVTSSGELSQQTLRQLLAGENTMAPLYPTPPSKESLPKEKIILDPTSILPHRSTLSLWRPGQPIGPATSISRINKSGRFQTLSTSLARLYQLAYLGKTFWNTTDSLYLHTWPKAIIETRTPETFESNLKKGTHAYNYTLTPLKREIPSPAYQLAMQEDLKAWFGYRANFQQREQSILKLVVIDQQKINQRKSKADSTTYQGDYAGYKLQKVSPEQLIAFIYRYHKLVIEDATGIRYPIDLELEANMTNLGQLRSVLTANGLALVESKRMMRVLVITD
ncbi:MAG: TlpA family protein disulfide reductase [Chitinophagaceae bacterium]|nr:MAG: TlpA family protein disulfide reductase [Chitinophagaceae bacterium]